MDFGAILGRVVRAYGQTSILSSHARAQRYCDVTLILGAPLGGIFNPQRPNGLPILELQLLEYVPGVALITLVLPLFGDCADDSIADDSTPSLQGKHCLELLLEPFYAFDGPCCGIVITVGECAQMNLLVAVHTRVRPTPGGAHPGARCEKKRCK